MSQPRLSPIQQLFVYCKVGGLQSHLEGRNWLTGKHGVHAGSYDL
jgi:hypothetical protein